MYGSLSCFGLENLHFLFDKEATMCRQFQFQKKQLLNYKAIFGSFSIKKGTEIIMEIQLI